VIKKIGEVLQLSRDPVEIDPLATYTNIGIRSFGKGLFHYPDCTGSELSKLRFYTFPVPALAVSNIKAWEGAVAMTSEEDHGCISSNRFLFYVPRDEPVDPRYIFHFLLSYPGRRALGAASPGSADRNRTLSIRSFEKIEIDLPDHPEQTKVADMLQERLNHVQRARSILREQEQLLERTWLGFLDDAFPG
jgi:type I restriction enzyme, S subunit